MNLYIMETNSSLIEYLINNQTKYARCFSLASSSDGNRVVACVNWKNEDISDDLKDIYSFTYDGSKWIHSNITNSNLNWSKITSSSDGNRVFAYVSGGDIYSFTYNGTNWTQINITNSNKNWNNITSSSDGNRVFASVLFGDIYSFTYNGTNWTQSNITTNSNINWNNITFSSDRNILFASENNGYILYFTYNGTNWTQSIIPSDYGYSNFTSSSDGNRIFAYIEYGVIDSYTYNGTNWIKNNIPNSTQGRLHIISSSDGNRLFATFEPLIMPLIDPGSGNMVEVVTGGGITLFTYNGTTWSQRIISNATIFWEDIVSSSDGSKLFACTDIYTCMFPVLTIKYMVNGIYLDHFFAPL